MLVAAFAMASRKEPTPESLAFVTMIYGGAGITVPPTVRFDQPVIFPAVSMVRLVGQVTGAEIVIFPAVTLPTVNVLAVIRPISFADKPSVVFVSVPFPRLISVPLPIGWIVTLPAEVAFTVPVRFTLLAVSVIRPPFE